MAFRVVVDAIERAATRRSASSTARYPVVPGRFKDYISTPEAERLPLAAHRRDRPGAAAHRGADPHPRDARGRRARRRRALDLQAGQPARPKGGSTAGCASCSTSWSTPPDPEEFLEHTKLEMFQDQVFCFTPKGDLIALPRGATPVDFAYAVHSPGRRHLRRRQDQRPACVPLRTPAAERRPGRDHHRRRRRRRRRPGSASSSPARRAPASAASSAPSSAPQYLELGRAIAAEGVPPGGPRVLREGRSKAVLKKFKLRDASTICTSRSARAMLPAARWSTPPSRQPRRGRRRARSSRSTARARQGASASDDGGADPRADSRHGACISPAAAIRCRATASSASSPPARASRSTRSTARRWRASPTTPERWLDVAWNSDGDAAERMSAASTSRSPTSPAASAA